MTDNQRRSRIHKRNKKVHSLIKMIEDRHPQWRMEVIIQKVAQQMYLSERTIEAIIRGEKDIYKTKD